MSRKFNYNEVKEYVEIESASGCKLISTEYKNIMTKMKFQCKCGNPFETNLNEFRNGKHKKQQCNDCGNESTRNSRRFYYDTVKQNVENLGYKLISKTYENSYTKLELLCSNNHIFHMSYNDLRNGHGCWLCQDDICRKSKYTCEEVDSYLKTFNYKLISKHYKNTKSNLKMMCPKGHIFYMPFASFKDSGYRCPQCRRENIANMANIKTTLRGNIEEWKLKSAEGCNYKCIATGLPFDDIHHVYSFNSILEDVCQELDIVRLTVEAYGSLNEEQVSILKEKCLEHHYKHPLGICMTREYHKLFHRLYTVSDNTEQQFDEFMTRCKVGEFDKIMEVKYGEYFQN